MESPMVLIPAEEMVAILQALLAQGRVVRMRVQGWSMHPALREGDVVWLEPAAAERVHLGDVVLYRTTDGRPVIHRVCRRIRKGKRLHLYLEGDRGAVPGEWVEGEQVLGRVVRCERAGAAIPFRGLLARLRACAFLARSTLARSRARWVAALGQRGQAYGSTEGASGSPVERNSSHQA